MTDFRLEQDLIGSKEVPAGYYYGIQTLRGIENFHNCSIIELVLEKIS